MMIKKLVLRFYNHNKILKRILDFFNDWRKYYSLIKRVSRADNDTIFLVLTPRHGNLGDHAIALEEEKMLIDSGKDYIEITGEELKVLSDLKKMRILNGNKILINGGGNLGVLWPDVDRLIREIVKCNPDSEIVIMPSTAYYDNSEMSDTFLYDAISTYSSHKKLIIFAREKNTYDFFRFKLNNIYLCPDMVLAMRVNMEKEKRHGCLLCFRSDTEKTLSDDEEQCVEEAVNNYFLETVKIDTVENYSIPSKEREKEVNRILNRIRTSELFITDRLHGMLFAAITETPCIVLNSKSPKVKGCYEWIEHLSYVRCVDSIDDISVVIDELRTITLPHYDNSNLLHYYQTMKDKIIKD